MRAAADAKVRKVILTSSAVTLPLTRPQAPPVTEDDWTDDLQFPYIRAKALAEKRAWQLSRELYVNLVTILPGAVCGPGFHRNTPSIDPIEGIMLGAMRMAVPNTNFSYVDVRDVVSAHALAAELDCNGRFIVCNDRLPYFAEIIDIMRGIDGSVPRPMMTLPGFMEPLGPFFDRLNHRMPGTPRILTPEFVATIRGKIWNASNARIKRELGWTQAVPIDASLKDTMQAIRSNRASRAG
jgi:dihydroflavonol-4-reductase